MIKVEGKVGISATVLTDSINEQGNRLITYELVYPRMVHAELLTHGMLVRNAASSRAIPFNKMAEQLTARPVRFGQANKGMQDKGEAHNEIVEVAHPDSRGEYRVGYTHLEAWEAAKKAALKFADAFHRSGYHKQIYNRITEPFQMMKVVLSGTELENYFWLRNHGAADPTLEELASVMHEARSKSVPAVLRSGEWHLPYVEFIQEVVGYTDDDQHILGPQIFFIGDIITGEGYEALTLEQAIKVSAARCAAVSFRNEDYGLEKCLEVYERLIGDERKHASAFQHQATPAQPHIFEHGFASDYEVNNPQDSGTWEPGISHADRDGQLWSAQLRGWIMFRKLVPGENYTGNS